jgi:hypothetical protein
MTTTRQEVDLKVIVSDNDLIIIETGAGSITINYEECNCLRGMLHTAGFELYTRHPRHTEYPGGTVPPLTPFPVKEIELS